MICGHSCNILTDLWNRWHRSNTTYPASHSPNHLPLNLTPCPWPRPLCPSGICVFSSCRDGSVLALCIQQLYFYHRAPMKRLLMMTFIVGSFCVAFSKLADNCSLASFWFNVESQTGNFSGRTWVGFLNSEPHDWGISYRGCSRAEIYILDFYRFL